MLRTPELDVKNARPGANEVGSDVKNAEADVKGAVARSKHRWR